LIIVCHIFSSQNIKKLSLPSFAKGETKKDWLQNFVLLWLRQNELPNPKPKHFFFATQIVANRCKISPFSLARRRGDRTAGA